MTVREIIKIDEARMNIVVSRRKLIEERRESQKNQLLERVIGSNYRKYNKSVN